MEENTEKIEEIFQKFNHFLVRHNPEEESIINFASILTRYNEPSAKLSPVKEETKQTFLRIY
jgi:hypothetical protein